MDTASLFFLVRHLSDLKHLSVGQWMSIVGAGVTAAGMSLAADPKHYEVAATAFFGTVVVAIVHVLQPSPIGKGEIKEETHATSRVDSANRLHL